MKNAQVARVGELLDVRLHSPLAQACPFADALDGRIALAGIVGVIGQREHDKSLGRAERLALEYRGHDLDAHSVPSLSSSRRTRCSTVV